MTAGASLKETVRLGISRVLVGSGTSAVLRAVFPKNGAVILMGHRVTGDEEGFLGGLDPWWFNEQVAYLARRYEPVSLADLVRCFELGADPPRNSVVLTFDDGFRDNFEHALPVLERHRFPATVFVVTGCLETGELPWPNRLGTLFQRTSATTLRHPLVGPHPVELNGADSRRRAHAEVMAALSRLPRPEREQCLAEIGDRLGVEAPRDRMLTWEQAREMRARGVDFGAHTYSHPLLARVSEAEARWEMERSREDLRQHLGIDRPSFAFPGGSLSPTLVDLARSLGFRSVFQRRLGLRVNSPATTHQFALSRVGLPNAPAFVLEAELDGPLHAVRRLYRRERGGR